MALDQDVARENFRDLARLKGYTIKQVAELAGMPVGSLHNFTRRAAPADLGPEALGKVAKVLKVTTEDLFNDRLMAGTRLPPAVEDEDSPNLDESREGLLAELRTIMRDIDDPDRLSEIGDIMKSVARTAKDNYSREKLRRRRRGI